MVGLPEGGGHGSIMSLSITPSEPEWAYSQCCLLALCRAKSFSIEEANVGVNCSQLKGHLLMNYPDLRETTGNNWKFNFIELRFFFFKISLIEV